jgi:hypothetical protein
LRFPVTSREPASSCCRGERRVERAEPYVCVVDCLGVHARGRELSDEWPDPGEVGLPSTTDRTTRRGVPGNEVPNDGRGGARTDPGVEGMDCRGDADAAWGGVWADVGGRDGSSAAWITSAGAQGEPIRVDQRFGDLRFERLDYDHDGTNEMGDRVAVRGPLADPFSGERVGLALLGLRHDDTGRQFRATPGARRSARV